MHFYYLDEAGCTGADLSNAEQPIFVLGGISVRDEGWNKTQEVLEKAIDDYFADKAPPNFELHAQELLSPNGDGPFSGHARCRRNELALAVLRILGSRKHDVHIIAIDKAKAANTQSHTPVEYDAKIPYLLAYDYMITYIDKFISGHLGMSARGMIILDAKPEFMNRIDEMTRARRFQGPRSRRVKRLVEFSYAVDSEQNPMVQLSDVVVYCAKKFLELEAGYRNGWPAEAKQFFAECYSLIDARMPRKNLVEDEWVQAKGLNEYRAAVRVQPSRTWKKTYGIRGD